MSGAEEVLPPLPPFQPGVYQHWKTGDLYLALGVAANSEARGDHVVVYYSYAKQRIWFRDYTMWHEGISNRATKEGTSYTGPRFILRQPLRLEFSPVERRGEVVRVMAGGSHPFIAAHAQAVLPLAALRQKNVGSGCQLPPERSIEPMPANPNATIREFRRSHEAPGGPARPAGA